MVLEVAANNGPKMAPFWIEEKGGKSKRHIFSVFQVPGSATQPWNKLHMTAGVSTALEQHEGAKMMLGFFHAHMQWTMKLQYLQQIMLLNNAVLGKINRKGSEISHTNVNDIRMSIHKLWANVA